ncbi:hypothetical protein, partial [Mesorhizobium sp. M7A.F.Ca.US.014.04.1.1]|uniref:hypothetical protein n=1 Tax=Mesorhizobium sp. M7A.F.Ca.US.014.04.1.1 TaxID=2496744 RepID=UPI0019D1F70D
MRVVWQAAALQVSFHAIGTICVRPDARRRSGILNLRCQEALLDYRHRLDQPRPYRQGRPLV